MGARIGAIHDGLVGPFEIERLDQRLAHARVLEFVASRIDEPALRAGRGFVRQRLALDAAVANGGEVIACRPYPRGELLPIEVVPGGESLKRDLAIPVEFITHDIEVVTAARDRKPGSPPILHALEFDEAVDLEFADLVRPATERGLERGFIERPGGV